MKQNDEKPFSLFRRIAGDLLIALTAFLAADTVVVMIRRIRSVVLKSNYLAVFCAELLVLGVLFCFALDVRFDIFMRGKTKAARTAGRILRAVTVCFTALFLFFSGRILYGCLPRTSASASHAIVLGAALQDGKPSRNMLLRVSAAESFLSKNPDAVLILTGGNPDPEEGKTEAAVMRDLLVADGVSEERLLLEDQAANTKENFLRAAGLVDPSQPVVIVTSGFHMDRAVRIAKETGFSQILRFPAPSDPRTFPADLMREILIQISRPFLRSITQ